MSHELSKLTMIDSDAAVHVSLENDQGDGFRKSRETRPLPGAEMQQRGNETDELRHRSRKGHSSVYRSLDMRRSIWSLRSMMDLGCDVYFAKDRCWIAKNYGREKFGKQCPHGVTSAEFTST